MKEEDKVSNSQVRLDFSGYDLCEARILGKSFAGSRHRGKYSPKTWNKLSSTDFQLCPETIAQTPLCTHRWECNVAVKPEEELSKSSSA